MSEIRVTPDELERVAGQFNYEGGNLEDILGRIHDLMYHDLDGIWTGEAKRAFFDQYNELQPSFNKMRELLNDIYMQLESTAEALRGADADIASQIRR